MNLTDTLAAALRNCRRELDYLRDARMNGIPVSVTHLVPERIEEADDALAAYERMKNG